MDCALDSLHSLEPPDPAILFRSGCGGACLCDHGPLMSGLRRGKSSDPAAIDDVVLVGAGAAVVSRQEDDDPGDVVRHKLALEALPPHDVGLAFGRQPQILLPL